VKLPRWTTYPALAALFAMILVAVPRRSPRGLEDALLRGPLHGIGEPRPPSHERVIVLGIDGLDPKILRETLERFPEGMRHFQALVDQGGLHELGTSTPPQSPVAWSNFITGLDPGGHGIFDFIHRDRVSRGPIPSTTKSEPAREIPLWGDWKFPLGGASESNRSGKAFWELLAERGVPADIWRMPANFPVEPADGLSFSGMMTPALDSAYGEFTFYTTDPPTNPFSSGKKVVPVQIFDERISTRLTGPANSFREHEPAASVPLTIYLDRENRAAAIDTGSSVLVMQPGEWSAFVPVTFSLLPAGVSDVHGIVRFYLRSLEPEFELYASPVNIDPLHPAMAVSAPESASEQLADARRGGIGRYYTQGMPEDVNSLKSEILTVPEFMQQAGLVHDEGVRMLDYALDHYLAKQDGGLLFFYFSTVDLCSHMMWRHHDLQHPHHDAALAAGDSSQWSHRPGSTWQDTVYDLYQHMDTVLGQIMDRAGPEATIIVMSDHGFAPYRRKFSLNTWLCDEGYLVLKPGRAKEKAEDDPEHANVSITSAVDWTRTRAYGMGFNGLYLNLEGREADDEKREGSRAGIVKSAAAPALLAEIKGKLEELRDPKDGARVVLRCDLASEVYHGERAGEAPDLIVGYNANYGNSDESTQGRIPRDVLADNLGGTFNGSHLMAPEVVPGVLLTNRSVRPGEHRLEDLTVEILKRYAVQPGPGMRGHPVLQ
jgi:predicted AlkP superfamily phosphohydrolase/phosphomutase